MPNDDTNVKAAVPQQPKQRNNSIKYFLMAIAAAAVAIWVFFSSYFNLSQSKESAGPEVPAEPFKHVWSEKKAMLYGIGDDITAGPSDREEFSYFQRLVKNPRGDSPDMLGKNLSMVFPNLSASNTASSWSNSINHREAVGMMSVYPDDVFGIVVMSTGLNEILHSYGKEPPREGAMYGATPEQAEPWLDNFQKRLDEMIQHIKYIFPGGCQIFIANIYDFTDGTGNMNAWITNAPAWQDGLVILEAYNQIIQDCAAKYENVHVVDIHKTFLGHGVNCGKFGPGNDKGGDRTCWYQTKSEDPSANERGHDVIRRLFLNEMIKVFYDANDGHQTK
jgi:hypothetical protein